MKKSEILAQLRAQATGITQDNKLYLVLKQDSKTGKTEPCPFCGKQHIHGIGEGHRIVHCGWDICRKEVDRDLTFQNANGETFKRFDGYILEFS